MKSYSTIKLNIMWKQFIVFTILSLQLYSIMEVCSDNKMWTYEVLDVKTGTSDPNIIDIDFKTERKSRGVYSVSGYMEFKIDADDSLIVEGILYRSSNGANLEDYKKVPLSIDNETLTVTMNKYYKEFVMESLKDCAENFPYFEEFEPPLTKRYIKLNKCLVSTDPLPSHMSNGYYRLLIKLHGPVEVFADLYLKIESVV